MKHTIAVLVENRFGVLARVSGLFSGRGFNIDSLAVGETDDPTISRMTIVVEGDERVLEQVMKQLRRLIDVIKVIDLTKEKIIERELLLLKVDADEKKRAQILEIVNIFGAKIVSAAPRTLTIEITGDSEKIEAFLTLIESFGIKELVRSGKIAIAR